MTTVVVKKKGIKHAFPLYAVLNKLRVVNQTLLELYPSNQYIIWQTYMLFRIAFKLFEKKVYEINIICPNKSKKVILKNISYDNQRNLIVNFIQLLAWELVKVINLFVPFWNDKCTNMTQRLWMPSADHLTLNAVQPNTWFSMETHMETTNMPIQVVDETKWTSSHIRCIKFPIYPTLKQKKILLQWMGTYRVVYNRTVDDIKVNKSNINFFELRNKHVTKKNNKVANEWEFETPKDIRAGAVKQLVSNYKSAFTNLKRGNIRQFKIGFKSKRQVQSISIPKTAIKLSKRKVQIYHTYMNNKINCHYMQSKKVIDSGGVNHDINLVYDNHNFYLHIPVDITARHNEPKENICAVDPGVRNFATIYSSNGCTKIKPNKEIIRKLHLKLDALRSLRARNLISKSVYSLKHYKVSKRINSLIDELHFKTCNYLLNKYEQIILPPYESQVMVGKNGISSNTKRNMLSLKPFQFRLRLKQKLTGHTVHETTEEFTSKTCTNCGKLKNNLGGNETYICDNCKLVIDRDINGARNILLKHLCTVTPG